MPGKALDSRGRRKLATDRTDEQLYREFRETAREDSLKELVHRHWDRAYRLALGLTRDPATAEDVAQEAFVQLVRAARAGTTLEPVSGWLAVVVLNQARTARRSTRRRDHHEAQARARRREETSDVRSGAIEEYADALPVELAAPLLLHYGLGLSHGETAQALGCPTGTVASRLRTALERLRERLGASAAIEAGIADAFVAARAASVPSVPSASSLIERAIARPPLPDAPKSAPPLAFVVGVVLAGVLATGLGLIYIAVALFDDDTGRASVPTLGGASSATSSSSSGSTSSSASAGSGEGALRVALTPGISRQESTTTSHESGRPSVASAELGEPDAPAPAYPWPEISPEDRLAIAENERLLDERKMNVSFEETPLPDVVAWWNELHAETGLPRVELDERLPASVRDLTVHLRVRGLLARNALDLIAASKDDLFYTVGPTALRMTTRALAPSDELACVVRWTQASKLEHKVPKTPEEIDEEQKWRQRSEAARAALKKAMESGKITARFEETPIDQVVQFLGDMTGAPVRLSRSVDRQGKVTLTLRDTPFKEALDAIAKEVDVGWRKDELGWEIKNEAVVIMPKEEVYTPPTPSGLFVQPASFDLRGITLRELRAELAKIKIELVLSPEGWRSNGTFSFVVRDVPLWDALKKLLSEELGFDRWNFGFEETDTPGEVVAAKIGVRGSVPSARAALATPALPYAGVSKQKAELERRLVSALAARAKTRASREASPEAIAAAEKSVRDLSAEILALVARTRALEGARERRAALPKLAVAQARLEAAKQALEAAPDAAKPQRECLVLGLEAKLAELTTDLARAERDVSSLDKVEHGAPLPRD